MSSLFLWINVKLFFEVKTHSSVGCRLKQSGKQMFEEMENKKIKIENSSWQKLREIDFFQNKNPSRLDGKSRPYFFLLFLSIHLLVSIYLQVFKNWWEKLLFAFRCIDIDFCIKMAKGSFSAKCTNNRLFQVFFFILKFDDIRSDGVLLFVARSVGTLD